MPSPPRILLPDFPVMITTRMEEGLPLAARPIILLLLRSILARAQFLFQVEINHLLIMGNHFHFLVRVLDPERVAAFMDHFKTESAHAVNRLLGRRKRTVWEDGYDSVPLLTLEDTIKKIVYIYTNPQSANLESTIDLYPMLSSWSMFQGGSLSFTSPWIRRNRIEAITDFHSAEEEREKYHRLLTTASEHHTFTLSPNGWMGLFGVTEREEQEKINARIVADIREVEGKLAAERAEKGQKVLGADRLRTQPINTPYTPKKFSKRMWCVCSDVALRVLFIQFIKGLIAEAREVSRRWRQGDFSRAFPVGLFPPRFPRLANFRPGTVLA